MRPGAIHERSSIHGESQFMKRSFNSSVGRGFASNSWRSQFMNEVQFMPKAIHATKLQFIRMTNVPRLLHLNRPRRQSNPTFPEIGEGVTP